MHTEIARLAALGVDVEPTLKRFYGDCDLLVEMLHEFADEGLADQLPDAFESGDLDRVERIAHAVKGTSANLGLMELSARCNDVVQAVRAQQLDGLDALVTVATERYRTARDGIAAL